MLLFVEPKAKLTILLVHVLLLFLTEVIYLLQPVFANALHSLSVRLLVFIYFCPVMSVYLCLSSN